MCMFYLVEPTIMYACMYMYTHACIHAQVCVGGSFPATTISSMCVPSHACTHTRLYESACVSVICQTYHHVCIHVYVHACMYTWPSACMIPSTAIASMCISVLCTCPRVHIYIHWLHTLQSIIIRVELYGVLAYPVVYVIFHRP